MPVGHRRINDPNAHPNPDITFIQALADKPNSDKARELLEALAAQFRPITKNWGLGVNSLEEHEWNPQFGGRNWNGGEVIEIVLRRPDNSFHPYQWLLFVMCHELAHIKHMNHAVGFQKVNKEIRRDLAKLRAKKYYGDGFWSGGRNLTGGNQGAAMDDDDQPNYTCGGAMKRSRKRQAAGAKGTGPRRATGAAKPGQTGRQTAILRKAGVRVKKQGAFQGEGVKLNDAPEMSTFRRQANAKTAVEARAAAAEARQKREKAERDREAGIKPKIESDVKTKRPVASSSSAGAKGKGKVEIIELSSSDDDDDDGEDEGEGDFEDPPMEENDYDQDELEWMDEDKKTWQNSLEDDDFLEVVDSRAVTTGGAKGKGKDKPSLSSSKAKDASSKGTVYKRLIRDSDSDGPPKKLAKPKPKPAAAPAPPRKWRPTSEEFAEVGIVSP